MKAEDGACDENVLLTKPMCQEGRGIHYRFVSGLNPRRNL